MKRLMIVIASLLVLCLLLPVSCQQPPEEQVEVMVAKEAPSPRPAVDVEEGYSGSGATKGLSSTSEERMIVRNGDMSLVVEDVVGAMDEIAKVVKGMGGYVVSSWVSGEEQEIRGNISIRVPDEKFEDTLAELRDLAVRVESESTNSRDVTEEYVDLEARLKNAEATESQYLALLDEARDVEDILKIYDSLSRVRQDIEQIKGRMQYLERTVSMSLISVYLEPKVTARPLVPRGWNIAEVFKSVIRGIVIFGQVLVTVLIWLLILSPVWGTILGIFLWRRRRRKQAE